MRPPLLQPNQPTHKSFRTSVLGVPIDTLSRAEIQSLLNRFLTEDRPHHIVTANSLYLLEAQKSPHLVTICEEASLVVADSSGLIWAARRLQLPPLSRLPGIDLSFYLCQLAELQSLPVYLLGGESGVAHEAAHYLNKHFRYLQVAGMRDGFFKPSDHESILRDIARTRARVVLVAMGSPKQEIWINANMKNLPPAIYMGVGGTLDIWAGRLKRAPRLFQKTGTEWLYRLGQEPTRFDRIAQLPKFAYKILSQRVHD